jgi:acyl-protein synthetase LuxE
MTSDLSIFAARLRDFISICAEDPAFASGDMEPALKAHYDAEFNGMALVLFALQFHRNAAFRKFCEARNVFPDAITRWTQIPAMPTSAFKELDLTCLPEEQRTSVFHSSGTTSQRPSRHFHSAESLAAYEASLWPWFRHHVIPGLTPDTSRFALLCPPSVQAPHSSLAHMFAAVQRLAFGPAQTADAFFAEVSPEGGWILDLEKTLRALEHSAGTGRPLVLLGTAFLFVHLLDHLREHSRRFDLPAGSRVMETGGYKGRSRTLPKAELHALITRQLGIRDDHIVCEYGMSELSSQAYDLEVRSEKGEGRAGERSFHFPPWARSQIISPETGREVADGETGLLRIFDLANVFSVMAVQTEDLAVRRGDGFELLGRAESAEPRGCSLMAGLSPVTHHSSLR